MLLLTKVDLIPQEKGCKQNLVWPSSSAGGKIILTLFAKIVAFYMELTMVDVRDFGLEFVCRSTF